MLGLVVAVGACLAAIATATSSSGGWDVSWPQCSGPGASTSVALPGSPTLGIVGVNNGSPFTTNSCMRAQLAWAGASAEVYINTENPGSGSHWPTAAQLKALASSPASPEYWCETQFKTSASEIAACAYGYSAAGYAYTQATGALGGLGGGVPTSPTGLRWWLDAESGGGIPWSASAPVNTAAIAGMLEYLTQKHVMSVGIYANRNDAHTLFTSNAPSFPAGTFSWLATGASTLSGGTAFCSYPSFTDANGQDPFVGMVQYWPSSPQLDADAWCTGYISGNLDPVAGTTATGWHVNLNNPAPTGGATLTVSSSSPTGQFQLAGTSTWSPTVTVAIPKGSRQSPAFAYTDTRAGTPTIAASGTVGRIGDPAIVTPGPVRSVTMSPTSLTLRVLAAHALMIVGYDVYGNAVLAPPAASWTASSSAATVTRGPSARATLTGVAAGAVRVTAIVPGYGTYSRNYTVIATAGQGIGTISGTRSVAAGASSVALHVRVWTPAAASLAVTVHASSPGELVATGPAGPWKSSVVVTIPAKGITSTSFYARATRAGTALMTATSATWGATTITGSEPVVAGPVARIAVTPAAVRLVVRHSHRIAVLAWDRFGNPTVSSATWTAAPTATVQFSMHRGTVVVIHARKIGVARVSATAGRLVARSVITIIR